jgi:hypothetical protein
MSLPGIRSSARRHSNGDHAQDGSERRGARCRHRRGGLSQPADRKVRPATASDLCWRGEHAPLVHPGRRASGGRAARPRAPSGRGPGRVGAGDRAAEHPPHDDRHPAREDDREPRRAHRLGPAADRIPNGTRGLRSPGRGRRAGRQLGRPRRGREHLERPRSIDPRATWRSPRGRAGSGRSGQTSCRASEWAILLITRRPTCTSGRPTPVTHEVEIHAHPEPRHDRRHDAREPLLRPSARASEPYPSRGARRRRRLPGSGRRRSVRESL